MKLPLDTLDFHATHAVPLSQLGNENVAACVGRTEGSRRSCESFDE